MMLDEYRTQLIGRLKSCRDTTAVRGILAEADLVLMTGRLARLTQNKFWETLCEDLDTLGAEAKFMTDGEAGVKLSTVVAAAQALIERYRERIAGDQE
jgi:hypothetical protein